jgi:hypothetical protein
MAANTEVHFGVGKHLNTNDNQNVQNSDDGVERSESLVSGLCPSSGILNIIKHAVLETGSISVLRRRGRHLLCWVQ